MYRVLDAFALVFCIETYPPNLFIVSSSCRHSREFILDMIPAARAMHNSELELR